MSVISVISQKGGEGKTPISFNLANELGSRILTNDNDILELIFAPNAKIMPLKEIASYDLKNSGKDFVIDFGGFVEAETISIIKDSDLVIVPTRNNPSSIKRGYQTIQELQKHNKNIIVVVTMTKKDRDFGQVQKHFKDLEIKAFYELKLTELFGYSMEVGQTINEYVKDSPLMLHRYGRREGQINDSILEQWDNLMTYIKGAL